MHISLHYASMKSFKLNWKLRKEEQEGEEEEEENKQEGGRKGETCREEEVRGRRAEMEEAVGREMTI